MIAYSKHTCICSKYKILLSCSLVDQFVYFQTLSDDRIFYNDTISYISNYVKACESCVLATADISSVKTSGLGSSEEHASLLNRDRNNSSQSDTCIYLTKNLGNSEDPDNNAFNDKYQGIHKTVCPLNEFENSDGDISRSPVNSKTLNVTIVPAPIYLRNSESSERSAIDDPYQDVHRSVSPLNELENSAENVLKSPLFNNDLNLTIDPSIRHLLNAEYSDDGSSDNPYKENVFKWVYHMSQIENSPESDDINVEGDDIS